jgi:type I restriction enzyme S subunit
MKNNIKKDLPKGWEYGILEDAVNKGSSNISLNKIKDEVGEYPVFKAKGFAQNVSFFQQEKEYLAIIKDGAGIGRVSKHPAKSSVVATMQYLIPKDNFDIGFIKYFLNGVDFQKYKKGSTIPHVYFKDYKNEEFPLISLKQQQQIVAILDKAFITIDTAKANAEQNLLNAKQLFESYLQNVFINKGDDWVEKELKDLGLVQTGTTPPTKDKSNYGNYIPFAKPPHFNKDGTIDTKDSMLSEKGLEKGRLFPANSILMVCIGATIGKTGYSFNPISSNQQINALTPNDNYDTKFLYYALISKFVQKQIMDVGRSSQATLPIINKSKWSVLKINVSKSIQEQQKIVKKLNALQSQTKALEAIYQQKIDDLIELKKSTLQKAFNGEL